jgi:tol-pal system protein YbgF
MRKLLLTSGLALAVAAPAALSAPLTVEQRLERIERRVDLITELTLQLQALRQENQELRGQLEVQQHQLQSLERKQRDLYLDIDQRLSTLQQPVAAAPVTPAVPAATTAARPAVAATPPTAQVTPSAAPAVPRAVAPVDPAAEKAAYQAAYDLLRPEQRRYQEATVAFTEFLAKYPDGALAPNARYWLAEAYYVTGQNEQAMTAFRTVVEQHADSPKVPGAWLKIGYILHAQGKTAEAREVLQRVGRDYPDSPAAGMARKRLDRIASEGR